ncbi:2-iminobutanoate/2-iminopropanoate deaminase [Octopus sinensis]|uniref:2-iminobutanoate/2-iminopropanoate deaminase n=1 Tax=Octopus sinensis TaxID=2607531 RepID=A0A6P7SUU8_9MOLL|nr:2-iminobutanoate/2-iminopropanoate deaminase [Octopus sinensis]
MAGICKRIINTVNAPKAIGAYSQAVVVDKTMYISGQLGLNPTTMEFPSNNAAEQADQALKNMSAILKEAGASLSNVVKTTVLLADINDFQAVNEIYSKYFAGTDFPARAAYQVGNLPKLARVEIEAIAVLANSQL